MRYVLMAGLNWTIAGAYIFIAAALVPRLALPRAPRLMGGAFLVACAFTHLDLAHHALARSDPFLVDTHMFVIHGIQAAVDWGFILLAFRHGRLMIRANDERVREYARAAAAEHAAAAEQRALSRIATAVAAERDPETIFALVAEEAAQLLEVETAGVLRFDGPEAATLMGAWSTAAEPTAPVGVRLLLETVPSAREVYRKGCSARADGPGFALAAPVRVGLRLWGAVTVGNQSAEPVAEGAESRLERLAELVGLAVSSTEAREALRRSEQRFRMLTTHAPVGIFELDPDGRCLFVNDRWAEMSGVEADAAVGASWGRSLHWLDRDRVVGAWNEAVRAGHEFSAEYRYLSTDRRTRWVAGRAVALRDESGAVTGHLGTVTDISDRKRAEEELARHASLLRAVLDASPDGICLVDLRGDVLLSNTALDHLLPWDRVPDASLHERTEAIAELTTDPSAFRAASAALGGNPVTQVPDEFELAPSGAVLQRHTRPVTLEGAPEAVFGRLFLFRDVTAERRAERAKDEFIALASHELRTPLTSIQGYVELLQETEDEPLGDRQRRHLAVVMRNARRLSLLVDDLLTVARADAGRLGLAVSDLDLGELVRDCVQASGPAALERGILLEGSQPPARGRGDRARLGQVLDNLVSNALKFTPPGGRIVVSARAEDGGNVLEVTDTGIGISADDQSRLFERFYRTSGAVAAAVPGTGLGLSISKMIVEAHGGLMEVHSTEGEGSTFRVVLPR